MDSTTPSLSVLSIDDAPEDIEILKWHLNRIPNYKIELIQVTTEEEGLYHLDTRSIDLIFLDYWMGQESGIKILTELRASGDERPIIILTGNGDERIAAECLRSGADDYLSKGELSTDALRRAIEGSVQRHRLSREKDLLAEELRQAQKMEAIGTLAGGLAHDFNNMLTSMVGFLELAIAKTDGTEVEPDLKQVQGTCKDMAQLIERLLSFSHYRPSVRKILDLRDVLSEVEVILAHTLPENVDLSVEFADPDEHPIVGNLNQIQQVILNLALNGSDAMPQGGRLSIETERVRTERDETHSFGVIPSGDYYRIQVTDTGRGIPSDRIDRLFEPFYTTKPMDFKKGTGLGLAVAWQHVRDHSGYIKVESTSSRGAVFSVFLPTEINQARGNAPLKSQPFPQGGETLLVVDDEDVVLDVTCEMLKKLGYEVLKAQDGVEALDTFIAHQEEVDAVVLDLNMPNMDGEECMQRLLSLNPELTILIATARLVSSSKKECLRKGAKDIIQKPFLFQDLATRLRKALDTPKSKEDLSLAN